MNSEKRQSKVNIGADKKPTKTEQDRALTTEVLLTQLSQDHKAIDIQRVMKILQDDQLNAKVDATKTKKLTRENICHLAVKNGHTKPLYYMLVNLNCSEAFKK